MAVWLEQFCDRYLQQLAVNSEQLFLRERSPRRCATYARRSRIEVSLRIRFQT